MPIKTWPRKASTDTGMPRSDWRVPAWHVEAKCAHPGIDPREYDAVPPSWRRGESTYSNVDRAVQACAGCPVAQQCAIEGLLERCSGTVHAGVPLTTVRMTPGQFDALSRVARGEPVERAVWAAGLTDTKGWE